LRIKKISPGAMFHPEKIERQVYEFLVAI